MHALVVGGTGPTGPFIVNGLLERGYKVSIFHRGTHEVEEIPDEVEHIHGDPHFSETIEKAMGNRQFDLVIATYGRIRLISDAMVGKAGRFIAIGGFAAYRGFVQADDLFPAGLAIPVTETSPVVASEQEQRFSWLMAATEQAVFDAHPGATVFRYPYVYGPYQVVPREWSIIRRILDGRRQIVLPDAGLTLTTHGYAENLAHSVLLAVDQPKPSANQIYNVGDDQQFSLAQIVEVIAHTLEQEIEIVSVPQQLASLAGSITLNLNRHTLLDTSKIRNQLGYRDVVPAADALARTTHWYVKHAPEPGGELEQRLGDAFDYRAEDKLITRYQSMMKALTQQEGQNSGLDHHPYPHPTESGLTRDHRNR